uniref:Uncharacterized protein n=1 Tax=Oryza rufipogon TaxID=4529 RepID=A0A0E0NS02_ORYRU
MWVASPLSPWENDDDDVREAVGCELGRRGKRGRWRNGKRSAAADQDDEDDDWRERRRGGEP